MRNEKFHASSDASHWTARRSGAAAGGQHASVQDAVQHVDFQRVSADEKIHIKVPLHFVNAKKSPAIKDQGGLITHVLSEIDVRCLPADLPEFIEVDLFRARDRALDPRALAHSAQGRGDRAGGKRESDVASAQIPKAAIAEEEEAAPLPRLPGSREPSRRRGRAAAADVPSIKQKAPEAAPPAEEKGKGGKGEKADKGDRGDKK